MLVALQAVIPPAVRPSSRWLWNPYSLRTCARFGKRAGLSSPGVKHFLLLGVEAMPANTGLMSRTRKKFAYLSIGQADRLKVASLDFHVQNHAIRLTGCRSSDGGTSSWDDCRRWDKSARLGRESVDWFSVLCCRMLAFQHLGTPPASPGDVSMPQEGHFKDSASAAEEMESEKQKPLAPRMGVSASTSNLTILSFRT